MTSGILPDGWKETELGSVLKRVKRPVELEPSTMYREIGIRSHAKGIFYKEERTGESIGEKSVFWIEPDCFIVNIVFAWEQAVAKTTIKEQGMIASHRFPMYQPVKEKLDLDYLLYFFNAPHGKYLLGLASPGGAGRNKTLGQEEFSKLTIHLPPYHEQRKISEILATWDSAISLNKHLINVKQHLKNGLTQQLLTGKKRFSEFENRPWRNLRLKEIAIQITDGTHVTPKYVDEGIPFISTSNLVPFTSKFDFSGYQKFITKEEYLNLKKRCNPEKGDLLVSKCGTIGRTQLVRINDEFNIFVGLALVKLDNKNVVPEFVEQLLNSDIYQNRMRIAAPGGTRATLTINGLQNLPISLPENLKEQERIASVLQSCDAEIDLLNEKLAALKQQKKGLMQKLLTGEISVKV